MHWLPEHGIKPLSLGLGGEPPCVSAGLGPRCAEGCALPAWVHTLGLWEEPGAGGSPWQAGPGGSFCDLRSSDLQGGGLN